jgi:hypothetical protein
MVSEPVFRIPSTNASVSSKPRNLKLRNVSTLVMGPPTPAVLRTTSASVNGCCSSSRARVSTCTEVGV